MYDYWKEKRIQWLKPILRRLQPAPAVNDTNLPMVPSVSAKQELKRIHVPHGWPHKLDPHEPVLLFTKPLLPGKLAVAGILPPDSVTKNAVSAQQPYTFRGRIGRGGRIIFDRSNLLMQTPIDCGNSYYMPPKPISSPPKFHCSKNTK